MRARGKSGRAPKSTEDFVKLIPIQPRPPNRPRHEEPNLIEPKVLFDAILGYEGLVGQSYSNFSQIPGAA
jgi:hypothetical protein